MTVVVGVVVADDVAVVVGVVVGDVVGVEVGVVVGVVTSHVLNAPSTKLAVAAFKIVAVCRHCAFVSASEPWPFVLIMSSIVQPRSAALSPAENSPTALSSAASVASQSLLFASVIPVWLPSVLSISTAQLRVASSASPPQPSIIPLVFRTCALHVSAVGKAR